MNVSTSRSVLTLFATTGLFLTIASTDTHAQTNQAKRPLVGTSSYSTTLKTYNKPLSVASSDTQKKSYESKPYESDRHTGSASSYSQPYMQPYIKPATGPIVQTVYVMPSLTMALPTAGPYQEGFQFRSRPQRMTPTTFVSSTTPFPTVAEQVGRAGANTLEPLPSYLGDSTRMTGQRISQEVIRMSLLKGVMGLKKDSAGSK